MVRIKVSPSLIEGMFRSGYKLGHLIEVISGLPLDAQLRDAKMENGMLALYFSQPRVPDSELQDIQVVLKSIAATPKES